MDRVDVDGHADCIQGDNGATTLTRDASTHVVPIQQWSTISPTRAQLIEFAEGVR